MTTTKSRNAETGLKNLRVGAFETRRGERMARLIEDAGGVPIVAESMRDVALAENRDAADLARRVRDGRLDVLIFLTGVGVRTLLKAMAAEIGEDALKAALGPVKLVSRGPKPEAALAEWGLAADASVKDPGTWRGVLRFLDERLSVAGRAVAVQEHGEPNRLFLGELKARGADVISVPVYKFGPPEDPGPLRTLTARAAAGEVDVLLFTNSHQVQNVFDSARSSGLAGRLRAAAGRMLVGSIGPVCSEELARFGLHPDFEPAEPSMEFLVAEAARQAAVRLPAKRRAGGPDVEAARRTAVAAPLANSLFLRACRREAVERTPIWLMRQAGRYMKEYRELRARVSFLDLCRNSDLAAEVTVDAAHRLGVDAAIIFSDILIVVEPLGFQLSYGKDEGPVIANPFRAAEDLKRVKPVDPFESLGFVYDAIRKTRKSLRPDLPLIGFVGAPFTLASYMIEGSGSRNFEKTKTLMYGAPDVWRSFLERVTDACTAHANAQIAAGAQAVQIFDSWAGCLAPEDYRRFVLPHTRRLVQSVEPGVPVISFATQTAGLLPLLREAGGDVIGLDWRVELDDAWSQLGEVAVQGNLDPVVLLSDPETIRSKALRVLNQAAGRPGHIFNLGHGVLPPTPIDNVLALIEFVKTESGRTP